MATAALIGSPVNRVDGRKKVTGSAQYAAEAVFGNMAYGVLVGSAIPSGRIIRIHREEAEKLPGVLLVLTHENRKKLGEMPLGLTSGGSATESRAPLADGEIRYAGQYVAMIVAESLEQARYAADVLQIDYAPEPSAVLMEDAQEWVKPDQEFGQPMQVKRGDVDAALAKADVKIVAEYATPAEHPCALEPHATVASWQDGTLTVHNATQWIHGDHAIFEKAFELPHDKIHVFAPFVGGMFGSKAVTGGHVVLTALAAREIGRPVKTVLSRTQVIVNVGHRTPTIQRLELGASHDGQLQAMRHHTKQHSAIREDFVETTSFTTRMLYACPNYEAIHEIAKVHVMKPSWMRAPGEAPCQFAQESAMDELAYVLGMDPLELRIRNYTEKNPQTGTPFSGKNLLRCYEKGAERFGWKNRTPAPRSMREGEQLIGYGIATATYPAYTMGANVKVRLERDGKDVRAEVQTGSTEVGTGIITMLALTAADGLALPLERVTATTGHSRLPHCALAGGSNLTSSTAPAANDACREIRRQLLELASHTADGFTGALDHMDEYVFANGRISHQSNPSQSISYADLLAGSNRPFLEAEGDTKPLFGQNDKYTFQSFGAHFVEVRVTPRIGKVRISRIVSVFDCGRILNAKAARSQFMGGIIFGIGHALLEELVYDRTTGKAINADLAGYLVPVNADVPEIDISWLDEPDYQFNSLGCRGVGEIGITGVAGAIANAVYHATGNRVRTLPITPDRVLGLS